MGSGLHRYLFILFLSALLGTKTSAQNIQFAHISGLEGLSQGSVFSITQDHQNYMWFATLDGLCRFNGSEMVVFKHDPTDSTSLIDNSIQCLLNASDSSVWIGTGKGLSIYDLNRQKMNRVRLSKSDDSQVRVIALYEDQDQVVWIGTDQGMYKCDLRNRKVLERAEKASKDRSFANIEIRDIEEDAAGRIWVGTVKGLYIWTGASWVHVLQDDAINELGKTKGEVVAFTRKEGVKAIEWEGQELKAVNRVWGATAALINPLAVTDDTQGRIWWAGSNGIVVDDNGKTSHLRNDPSDPGSIAGEAVRCLFVDKNGTIWVGTNGFGLSYYNAEANRFVLISGSGDAANRLSHEFVNAVYFNENDKSLLVGTYRGLDRVYMDNGKIERKPFDKEHFPLLSDEVKSIMIDSKNRLWAGTVNGLEYLDLKAKDKKVVLNRMVNTLEEDSKGRILVGADHGLYTYEDGVVTRILPTEETQMKGRCEVICITEDTLRKQYWIGTTLGLIIADWDLHSWELFEATASDSESLPAPMVKCVHIDRRGDVWVATWGGGVSKWKGEGNRFEHLGKEDGLPNEVVYGILEDKKGCLWFSTNNGLSRYMPPTGTFTNFDVHYGLQSNEFNTGAYCQDPSGRLYFGGVKGLNHFNPRDVDEETSSYNYASDVILTDIEINRQEIKPAEGAMISKAIPLLEELELDHNQNTLGFRFAVAEYIYPQSIRYRYKLDHFDQDWTISGNNTEAIYTNLPPGSYTFRVNHANLDGSWNQFERTLKVHIRAPWWEIIWIRFIAVLGIAILLYVVYKRRVLNLEQQKINLEEKVGLRTNLIQEKNAEIMAQSERIKAANVEIDEANASLKDLNNTLEKKVLERTERLTKANQEMDQFVYSVSHDIRAPLTSIMGLVNLMQMEGDLTKHELTEYLGKIELSAERLNQFTLNVLKFSRNSRQKLQVEQIDFHHLIEHTIQGIEYVPGNKLVELKIDVNQETPFFGDKSRMIIILRNLMSNSMRYRSELNPWITITVQTSKEQAVIEVTDNGIGIAEEDQHRVFDMFFRASQRSKGSGLGLYIVKEAVDKLKGTIKLQSKSGEGAAFHIVLPNMKAGSETWEQSQLKVVNAAVSK